MPQSSQTRTVPLERMGVAQLLFALFRQRFTGTVQLDQPGEGPRSIWFRGGMPIYTDWTSRDDVLGEILMQRGALSSLAMNDALARMARHGGVLGNHLVEMGLLDQPSLAEWLRVQCQRKLARVFALQSGEAIVSAEEHGIGLRGELVAQVDVLPLLRQGIAAHYDEARARREMAGALSGPLLAVQTFSQYRDRFGFREIDLALVDAIIQGTTFDSLLASGASRGRVAQVCFLLWVCQMLVPAAEALTHLQSYGAAIPQAVEETHTPMPVSVRAPGHGLSPPTATSRGRATPASGIPGVGTAPLQGRTAPTPPSGQPAVSAARPASGSAVQAGGRTSTGSSPIVATASTAPVSTPATAASRPGGPGETASAASSEETAFIERIADFEAKVSREANAFELFGLPLDADRAAIRVVWIDLSTRYHPDVLEAKGLGHHRARVEKVFAALSEANATLSRKEKREELRALLEAGGTGRSGETAATIARRALESETLVREADRLLRSNNFEKAAEGFARSLELHAEQPDAIVSLAWCRFNLDGRTEAAAAVARRAIRDVLEKYPNLAKGHYLMGMTLVAIGQDKLSIPCFETAKDHDPRLVDAERQLRAARIRLQQSGQATTNSTSKSGPSPAGSKQKGAPEASGAFASLRSLFGGKKS